MAQQDLMHKYIKNKKHVILLNLMCTKVGHSLKERKKLVIQINRQL